MDWRVKLFRKFKDRERYWDIKVKSLFLHILLTANIKKKKRQWIVIEKWQLITSYENLSIWSSLSLQETRTALKKLKKSWEINIQSTQRYSLVTVNNRGTYQWEQQTNNKPTTTTKERKNILFTNVNNIEGRSKDLKTKTKEFIDHRSEQKKKMTEKSLKLLVNKMNGFLWEYQESQVIEMMNTAIMSWRLSIYPPKNLKQKEKKVYEHANARESFTF